MLRSLTTRFSILACATLVLPCIASTQGRGVADLEAWLGRLVGNYTAQARGASQAQGTAVCQRVGAGSGVSCLFTLASPDGQRAPGMPQLMLFGIDPRDQTIQLLQLDFGEPAISARGPLRGDAVAFRSECPNRANDPAPTVVCDRSVTIRAMPGAGLIEISLESTATPQASSVGAGQTGVRIELHRESG